MTRRFKLSELVIYQEGPGVRDWEFCSSGVPLMNIRLMKADHTIQTGDARFVSPEAAFGKWKHFLLAENDIVVASSGSLGKRAWVRAENLPLMLNTSVIRFRPRDGGTLDRSYLWHYLGSSDFEKQFSRLKTGTAQFNFGPSHLDQMSISVPPLCEQKRIAAILDKADAIRRKREQAIKLADEFLRSLFLDMFGDPVRNSKGWRTALIGKLSPELRYGTSAKCDNEARPNTLPVLRIPNIVRSRIDQTDLKHAHLSSSEVSNLRLEKGDILFVRTNGNPEYIGRCAVFDAEEPMLFASYLIRARIPDCACLPEFLSDQLMTPAYRKLMLKEAQTTAGNYNVSASALSDLRVILPPTDIQQRYVKVRERVRSLISTLESDSPRGDQLFRSLANNAFCGGL